MANPKKSKPQLKTETTSILLKKFPLQLHRNMRAVAAFRGRPVVELYVEACRAYLAQGKRVLAGSES